ncbi:MAG TPA: TIGR02453 family protein [Ignavibacteriales bacterium]|nr:TIGR02453 family protein [Ignavibacteriales bacterium]
MKNDISFPQSTIKFLTALSKNNNKEWFEKNRMRYDLELLQPAIRFVIDLGEKLFQLSPNINAIPKIDKSIFRLYRDVRFSKNKAPFKTNLGLYFWEGRGKKMECSGLYFHIEPKLFFLGAGMYQFTNDQLKKYRNLVSDPAAGKELNDIILKLLKKKNFELGGKTYKKTPRGFDPNYKFNELLLHSGVYVFYESKNFDELNKKGPVDFSFSVFKDMYPLHKWFVENLV